MQQQLSGTFSQSEHHRRQHQQHCHHRLTRDNARILCFVATMKSPHALQIYSTVFCEEVYAVAFFKVVQQQTIGKVINSIMRLWT